MFTGTYENSIDGKNRIIIPSKHRDQLGGRCVLTRGLYDYCLYIYSIEGWNVLVDKIMKLPQSNEQVRSFMRDIFPNTEECTLDSQGRILIPANLREYAHIEKDLITMGMMDKIEVWSKELYNDPGSKKTIDNENFLKMLEQYEL
jgi:MraZ protein